MSAVCSFCLIGLFIQTLIMAAFCSLVEGKSEGISISELSGGARVHYIFQSIFVKSLEVCSLYISVLSEFGKMTCMIQVSWILVCRSDMTINRMYIGRLYMLWSLEVVF